MSCKPCHCCPASVWASTFDWNCLFIFWMAFWRSYLEFLYDPVSPDLKIDLVLLVHLRLLVSEHSDSLGRNTLLYTLLFEVSYNCDIFVQVYLQVFDRPLYRLQTIANLIRLPSLALYNPHRQSRTLQSLQEERTQPGGSLQSVGQGWNERHFWWRSCSGQE